VIGFDVESKIAIRALLLELPLSPLGHKKGYPFEAAFFIKNFITLR